MKKVRVKQATKQGYIECEVGGCFDASYPDSKLRRGRVQGGVERVLLSLQEKQT